MDWLKQLAEGIVSGIFKGGASAIATLAPLIAKVMAFFWAKGEIDEAAVKNPVKWQEALREATRVTQQDKEIRDHAINIIDKSKDEITTIINEFWANQQMPNGTDLQGLKANALQQQNITGLHAGLKFSNPGDVAKRPGFTDIDAGDPRYTKYSEEQRQLMENKWKQYYGDLKDEFSLVGQGLLDDSRQFTGRSPEQTDRYARLADAFNAQMLYDPGEIQVAQGRTSPNMGAGKWVTNPAKLETQDMKQMDKLRDMQQQLGQQRITSADEWARKKRDSKFEELSALLTQMQKELFHRANSTMAAQFMDYQRWDKVMLQDAANYLGMTTQELQNQLGMQSATHNAALQQQIQSWATMLAEEQQRFIWHLQNIAGPFSQALVQREMMLRGNMGDMSYFFNIARPGGKALDYQEIQNACLKAQNMANTVLNHGTGNVEAVKQFMIQSQYDSYFVMLRSLETIVDAAKDMTSPEGQLAYKALRQLLATAGFAGTTVGEILLKLMGMAGVEIP